MTTFDKFMEFVLYSTIVLFIAGSLFAMFGLMRLVISGDIKKDPYYLKGVQFNTHNGVYEAQPIP